MNNAWVLINQSASDVIWEARDLEACGESFEDALAEALNGIPADKREEVETCVNLRLARSSGVV